MATQQIQEDEQETPTTLSQEKYFIRAVPMATSIEVVQKKLDSIGIENCSLKLPHHFDPSGKRKYFEVSLSIRDANKVHSVLTSDKSVGWFISSIPPKAPKLSSCPLSHPNHRSSVTNLSLIHI